MLVAVFAGCGVAFLLVFPAAAMEWMLAPNAILGGFEAEVFFLAGGGAVAVVAVSVEDEEVAAAATLRFVLARGVFFLTLLATGVDADADEDAGADSVGSNCAMTGSM